MIANGMPSPVPDFTGSFHFVLPNRMLTLVQHRSILSLEGQSCYFNDLLQCERSPQN